MPDAVHPPDRATPSPPSTSQRRTSLRTSLSLRVVALGILTLMLWIPLTLVYHLVLERQHRQQRTVHEMDALWGGPQIVAGPVLVLPYDLPPVSAVSAVAPAEAGVPAKRGASPGDAGPAYVVLPPMPRTDVLYFLPEALQVDVALEPEIRRRGLFETAVYTAQVRLAGHFAPPDLDGWKVEPEALRWDLARVVVGVVEEGTVRRASFTWDGEALEIGPGGGLDGIWEHGVGASIGARAEDARDESGTPEGRSHRFDLQLTLLGSGVFEAVPLARSSVVEIASPWPDPSFRGTLLPESREVGEDGFRARWTLSPLAVSRQRWRHGDPNTGGSPTYLEERLTLHRQQVLGDFDLVERGGKSHPVAGVGLDQPADHYQRTERSVKYGLLVVVLTFTTVFLLEVVGRVPLHPIHYLLVGGALVVFYLLLLSLSEHVPFAFAYLAATVAVVTLVAGYAAAILRTWRRGAVLGAALAALYAFLWSLLTAVDYALLLGSVGLFAVLAFLMWFTRRIDWWRGVQASVDGEVC